MLNTKDSRNDRLNSCVVQSCAMCVVILRAMLQFRWKCAACIIYLIMYITHTYRTAYRVYAVSVKYSKTSSTYDRE